MLAKIIDNVVEEYPYSVGKLIKDNPQTSFPKEPSVSLLAEFNVFEVASTEKPVVDYTKNIKEEQPTQSVDGGWKQVWTVSDASAEEIAQRTEQKKDDVRADRNAKLKDSDWTQVIDAPVDQSAWAAYRQALRDITAQDGFPFNIEWPQQPTQ